MNATMQSNLKGAGLSKVSFYTCEAAKIKEQIQNINVEKRQRQSQSLLKEIFTGTLYNNITDKNYYIGVFIGKNKSWME